MKLFEFATGSGCDSYERIYIWAKTEERAVELLKLCHPIYKKVFDPRIDFLDELFDSNDDEFVTIRSEDGNFSRMEMP